MATATTNADPQAGLEWERIWRPRAAVAAGAGAVLSVAGAAYSVTTLADQPTASLLDSLSHVEAAGPVGDDPSVQTPLWQFYDSHTTDLVIAATALILAMAGAALALFVLHRATTLRMDRLPRWTRFLPVIGLLLFTVGSLLLAIGTGARADNFLDLSPTTVDEADGLGTATSYAVGQFVAQFGGMLMAAAYVMIALNAMRAGLLPRAWGMIGIFAGVLLVFPVAAMSQLLQPVFLIVLALILLGRYPGVKLPAWASGEAVPWPSAAADAQRRREEKDRKQHGGSGPPDPEPVERAAKPHPSSKKRKRKKRG